MVKRLSVKAWYVREPDVREQLVTLVGAIGIRERFTGDIALDEVMASRGGADTGLRAVFFARLDVAAG